ncbi:type IX secretion system membrane protein, PorP/SprF family [Pedobacter westerhofensis]|uniref:Type IX secretion system membrane protein, PorP/SprF family n=1 Tax=Pedobacter westerhofensis TaxID=425512 RepID=A0A521EH03_9SPHI|nr:PorP/SprF family type IX secretion system membrane protein [Pedobacter westerhofensis]SMO83188.1 type IX secretion system membrane protein, PorP/SprF family [Pedobacter westerhofensis]
MKKMKLYLRYIVLVFLSGWSLHASGQDHIYSQFYNAPLYLNPALTGQFEGDVRLNMIYRNQWSGLNGTLSYVNASGDLNIPNFGGGVGLQFNRSTEGTAFLVKNNIAATYAYSVGSDDFVLSFGIQAGFTNRRINWDKLVFSDQIDNRLGYIPGSVSSAQLPDMAQRFFFDPGAGVNLVYGNFMAGAAVYHINQPDESFSGAQAKLPRRIAVNASYRLPLTRSYNYGSDDGSYLIPSVVYYKQGNVSSMSAGAQYKYKGVNAGLWYRTAGEGGPDAIVVSLIFDIFSSDRKNGEKLRVGISHDATTSKINYTNTNGTSEGSIGYQKYFPNSSSYNKFNGLRCYDFY